MDRILRDYPDGHDEFTRLKIGAILLSSVMIIGTMGYRLIEKWSFLDAIYMTVITLTTVGFREVHPLSGGGKVFTIFLLLTGVGSLLYTAVSAIEFTVEGHLGGWMERRRTERAVEAMKDHYILCGYGRVGAEIAREFRNSKLQIIVIEDNLDNFRKCLTDGFLCLNGDATKDEMLLEAGIEHAKGILTALSSDQKNVLVSLTARTLNDRIFIVGRGESEESHRKLRHAGADRVISPYTIGGRRMASLMIKPYISDYLDVVMHGDQLELQLDEMPVSEKSELAGKSIRDTKIRDRTGALILAVSKKGRELNTNPQPEYVLESGDVLLVIGTTSQLDKLDKLV